MAPDWLVDYDWADYNHNSVSDDEIARLEAAFGAFFATKTRRELYEQALARRIMLAPCNDAREILDQAQLRARSLFTTIDYPEFGASIEHPDFFAKSSRCRIGIRSRAPRIGEHNAEVFGESGCRRRISQRCPPRSDLGGGTGRWDLRGNQDSRTRCRCGRTGGDSLLRRSGSHGDPRRVVEAARFLAHGPPHEGQPARARWLADVRADEPEQAEHRDQLVVARGRRPREASRRLGGRGFGEFLAEGNGEVGARLREPCVPITTVSSW